MGQGLYLLLPNIFNILILIIFTYYVILRVGWLYEKCKHTKDFKKIEEIKKMLRSIIFENVSL
jgi:hypothetical protein